MATRDPIRTEVLLRVLPAALSRHFGGKVRITRLQRRRSRYSSSFPIENLALRLAGGKSLQLVFKDSSPGSLLESAQQVRPRFLYDPAREIEIYRGVLDPVRFGTPVFYGAVAQPELSRYWLFLERVPGPLLWQVGEIEIWRQAARWLAQLHSHFAQAERRGGSRQRVSQILKPDSPGTGLSTAREEDKKERFAPLLRYDRRWLSLWWNRAERFLSASAPRGLAEQRTLRSFIRLTDRHERVVDRLLALADTFIHGEFYPSNVILRRQGSAVRICPIDWEVAAIGPGLIDLAALTSGAWSADQKKGMIAAYREALEPRRGWPPSLAELIDGVRYCQLHLAVQWLGWAADWSPPKLHARNWLREAVTLSTTLGI